MGKSNAIVTILLIVVLAFGGLALAISNRVAQVTNANAVRVAEAQAREAQAIAIAEAARVEQARAAGERAILEAAAGAVETNTELVEYYAKRGDARAREVWQWIVAGVVCAVVVALASGRRLASLVRDALEAAAIIRRHIAEDYKQGEL